MDIAIIGAGPAGNYTAFLLAQKGHQVTIYEEHNNPGLPIQCTGILTSDLAKHVELSDDYIVNRMQAVQVFGPNNETFKAKNDDIIVCRHKFDTYLLKKAIASGAHIEKGTKFIAYNKETKQITLEKDKTKVIKKVDILIGADGPNSKVSKIINHEILQKHPTVMYLGAQATVKGNFDPKTYHVYLGSVCPEFFAWVVPESKTRARIGLATKKTPNKYFNALLKKRGYSQEDITAKQGGLIPCYNPHIKVQQDNIYLIGDAATIIKSTTGGGIIPHLEAAKTLVMCIEKNKDFNRALKRKKIFLHLLIRFTLDQFSDEEYNELIVLCKQPRVQKTLQEYTRDNLIELGMHLLLRNPLLIIKGIKYLPKVVRALHKIHKYQGN